MEIAYINGKYLPKEEITISPDDRGFLFSDGIYEVVRWYKTAFYDIKGHLARLKRSLGELKISWPGNDSFPAIAEKLVKMNDLSDDPAMVYIQVTRGAAPRTHHFPRQETQPTVYAYAFGFRPNIKEQETGIRVMLKEDIRWSRCDIKSVSLLANTISFQEAREKGFRECIFSRNGRITEGSHSNIFFVTGNIIFTHPESNLILPGITRKNIIRIAKDAGMEVREEAIPETSLSLVDEAFITNTSDEVTPVTGINGNKIGDGSPGPVSKRMLDLFREETTSLKA